MKMKTQQISIPEVTKMLRDHDTYPQLVKKDELQALFKLINMKHPSAD